jgi:hypothetical protein
MAKSNGKPIDFDPLKKHLLITSYWLGIFQQTEKNKGFIDTLHTTYIVMN